jgi:hypothetical protein
VIPPPQPTPKSAEPPPSLIAETRLRLALQTQLTSARATAAAQETALRHTAEATRREADVHAARAAQAEHELGAMRARAEEAEREVEGLRMLLGMQTEVSPELWDAVRMIGMLADEAGGTMEEGEVEM